MTEEEINSVIDYLDIRCYKCEAPLIFNRIDGTRFILRCSNCNKTEYQICSRSMRKLLEGLKYKAEKDKNLDS